MEKSGSILPIPEFRSAPLIPAILSILLMLVMTVEAARGWPNEGGVLTLHDTGLSYTADSASYPSPPPADCGLTDVRLPVEPPPAGYSAYVWKMYAVFPEGSAPRLKGLAVGESFNTSVRVVAGGLPDPAGDFEVPDDGWPTTSGGGCGIVFGTTRTTLISECYWFAGYSYSGVPGGLFGLIPIPAGNSSSFVDDAIPGNMDLIAGLGSVGFGIDGTRICPEPPYVGACCVGNGGCVMMHPDRCDDWDVDGVFVGGVCEAAGCAPGPGACCLADGTCRWWTPENCQGDGRVFMGEDVPCAPDPCGSLDVPVWPPAMRRGALSIQPNPFAARGSIRVSLERPGGVLLTVATPAGTIIRTERMVALASGERALTWDGRDDAGREAPAGAYFIRVVTPEGEHAGRAVLLR